MRTSERVQAAIECTSVAYISALNNIGFRYHYKSNRRLCGTTRRRFPISGRFQTRLGIFQPSNQNVPKRTERIRKPFQKRMRYYFSFSWFLLLCLYRDNISQN